MSHVYAEALRHVRNRSLDAAAMKIEFEATNGLHGATFDATGAGVSTQAERAVSWAAHQMLPGVTGVTDAFLEATRELYEVERGEPR